MRRRIAYVINNLDYGGTERHLLELLTHLDRSRFEPAVFCRDQGGPLVAPIEALEVPVQVFGIRAALSPDGLAREWRLMAALRRFRPHLISYYMGGFYLPEVMAGLLSHTGRVIINHRDFYLDWPRRFFAGARIAGSLAPYSTACSHAVAGFLLEHKIARADRLDVIYNGVHIEPFQKPLDTIALRQSLGVGPDEFVIGTVARLHPKKRQIDLVDAAAVLRDQGRRVRVVLAGDGAERAAIEARVRERQLEDRVLLLGRRADGRELIRTFDVSVLVSLAEGSPNTVIETMLSGVPLVASDVPGTAEIVADGETALVVPPRDPERLARALARYLDDTALRERCARQALAYARETFSLDHMLDRFMDLYERVLRLP